MTGSCDCIVSDDGEILGVCVTHSRWREVAITDAVRAERKACAEVAREVFNDSDAPNGWGNKLIFAIEARNNPAPSPLDQSATPQSKENRR